MYVVTWHTISLYKDFYTYFKASSCISCYHGRSSQEAKVFLLWEKTLHLLLRQLRFGSSYANTIPHFTCLAATLARYGEDKATEGILGVIGLGRKSSYSHE